MQETNAFLEWRRDIAALEENNVKLAITPFEKNIEVWKQLWRVIEKSDLLLQIVDARNPYFYYSQDLDKYIQEMGGDEKEFILCINKADFLSEQLIEHWNQYFLGKGIKHIFFSAKLEQEKLDNEDMIIEEDSDEDFDVDDEEEKEFEPLFDDLKKQIDHENELRDAGIEIKKPKANDEREIKFNTTEIYTRELLIELLNKVAKEKQRNHDKRLFVGTVGYPNVGKSSLINVLCGRKRVGVAAMPGKTKHF